MTQMYPIYLCRHLFHIMTIMHHDTFHASANVDMESTLIIFQSAQRVVYDVPDKKCIIYVVSVYM